MDEKMFTFSFNSDSEKLKFLTMVGNISESSFAEMCGISMKKSYQITGEVYRKVDHVSQKSVKLTGEELRCLTVYISRNPTELTPLSGLHNRFLLVAHRAGFEIEKPVWVNSSCVSMEELSKKFKKLTSFFDEKKK